MITTDLAATTGTLHYLSVAHNNLSPPGLGGAQVIAYGDGDPSWSGRALISGGWYSRSGIVPEIVSTWGSPLTLPQRHSSAKLVAVILALIESRRASACSAAVSGRSTARNSTY